MATQKEQADLFKSLHVKGSPVILFNIWDPWSARTVEQAGAKAIATGSWSVAAANGFTDGEALPLELAIANAEKIVSSVSVPVTLDFEGGYATRLTELKENIKMVLGSGVVGINFEDQVVGGEGLYSIEEQAARIAAIRETAEDDSIPLYINARTDVFLKTYPAKDTEEQLEETMRRADAYAAAGASGLFVPGLRDVGLIKSLCERTTLPVNVMMLPDAPPTKTLAQQGVARISYGPIPYRQMTAALQNAAQKAFAEL
jgi:2-methylisocitrate lyase-like PEP mutase family enzyme